MKDLSVLMSLNSSYSLPIVADILSVSKATLLKWEKNQKLVPEGISPCGSRSYSLAQLLQFDEIKQMHKSLLEEELSEIPLRAYTSMEFFAGAGGLALGLEKSGFDTLLFNEIDSHACATLKKNRPKWNVICNDIYNVDLSEYEGKVDFISGGFPCQAFSYAGNKLGFDDARGTLFFKFAKFIEEIKPKVFLAENVKGLLSHDDGRTLKIIKKTIQELGYTLIEPKILKAMLYKVPQKRERLFLVCIRNDLFKKANFSWPSPHNRIMTLRDALKAGELYSHNVSKSEGQSYPQRKKEILSHVPPGGYWRDLPDELQREYMQKSYFLGGGKTGMARRLSWDEPSLTLTCAPAQKQTERCHPEETRPLNVREYARIQTFPDDWIFEGSQSNQYKQIGNAVPVNLAHAVGCRIVNLLNQIEINRG